MTQKQATISFVGDATTREAFIYIIRYTIVIIRNVWRAVNHAVHRLPWLFILLAFALSFIVSFISIGKARAERDSYNQKNVELSQKVASYEALYGKGK